MSGESAVARSELGDSVARGWLGVLRPKSAAGHFLVSANFVNCALAGCNGCYKFAMRLVIMTAFALLPLIAQTKGGMDEPGPWKRHVLTTKGDWFDAPRPQ